MARPMSQAPGTTTSFASWMRLLTLASPSKNNDDLLLTYFLRECGSDPTALSAFIRKLKVDWRNIPPRKRMAIAVQYLRVLSPLCERFGLFAERQAMDDMCFKTVDPKNYAQTNALLSKYRKKSQSTVKKVIHAFSMLLKEHGYESEISGRYKQLYSIHKKLQTKKYTSVLNLQDIFAFRIILEKNDAQVCFDVLNLLHDTYSPVTERFKDYVSIPKVNGYQSIHTVLNNVLPALDLPMEVQIRTRAMDEFAEHGLASHWLYSRNKRTQLLSTQEHRLLAHYRSLAVDLSGEQRMIYCLAPDGRLLELSEGSTLEDFAYRIHTELGKMAIGGEVNDRQASVSHVLHHGDQVRVLTSSKTPTTHAKRY